MKSAPGARPTTHSVPTAWSRPDPFPFVITSLGIVSAPTNPSPWIGKDTRRAGPISTRTRGAAPFCDNRRGQEGRHAGGHVRHPDREGDRGDAHRPDVRVPTPTGGRGGVPLHRGPVHHR